MSQIEYRQRLRERAEQQQPARQVVRTAREPQPYQEEEAVTVPPANSPGPINTAATTIQVSPPAVPTTVNTAANVLQLAPGQSTPPNPTRPHATVQPEGEGDGFNLDPHLFTQGLQK